MNQKTVIHIGAPFHSIYNDRQKGPTNCRIDKKLDGFKIPWEPIQMGRFTYVYTYPIRIQVSNEQNLGCFGYIL